MFPALIAVFTAAFMLTLLKGVFSAFLAAFIPGNGGIPPDTENADTDALNALQSELAYLTAKLDSLEELQRLTEHCYQSATNVSKQATLLRRMITLDDQIHALQRRIAAIERGLPP